MLEVAAVHFTPAKLIKDQVIHAAGNSTRFARTLDDEPTVISHLVRNAILRMAVKATERNLNRVTPSNEMCKRLQDAFTRAGETNLLPLAFVGERAMPTPTFRLSWNEIQ